MIPDYKPILVSTPEAFEEIEIYFAHDIHYGSDIHDRKKWERFKADILSQPNRFVIWCGDYCETALINSKSDVYSQTANIEAQRIWMEQQFYDLRERTLAIISGNHENRITKVVGLYPVYDAAVCAGIGDKFRHRFACIDIGVGSGGHGKGKQLKYVGFAAHKMKDCKNFGGADYLEGFDFVCFGHDHDPKDHARSKLVYDSKNKSLMQRDVECIDSGSFLSYGGYGAEAGYRPQSTKLYKIVLNGREKRITTVGYHI